MPDVAVAPPIDTPATAPISVVPTPATAPPVKPATPAKVAPSTSSGSPKAMERVKQGLAKLYEDPVKEPEKKPIIVPRGTGETPDKSVVKPETDKTPVAEPEPPLGKDGKPLGAWQLKEKWQKEARKFESEVLDLRSKLSKVPDTKALSERAERAEARLKELSEEIKFVNYAKSDEFVEKYQKPYESAWSRAVTDMKELTVTLEDGSSRPADAKDLLLIANLPLGEARKQATAMFGDSAGDVMAHRQKVRELSDAQTRALDESRKTAGEREKQMNETRSRVSTETSSLWQQFKTEDEQKHDFLREKEGDDEWNNKLDSSRTFVDTAFSTQAADPSLTAEQRADAVKKHAAVRGRAIGYSMLKLENTRLKAEVAKAQKELGEYRNGEPGVGNGRQAAAPSVPLNPMEAAKARLAALAI